MTQAVGSNRTVSRGLANGRLNSGLRVVGRATFTDSIAMAISARKIAARAIGLQGVGIRGLRLA
jgi:hypothetical protein